MTILQLAVATVLGLATPVHAWGSPAAAGAPVAEPAPRPPRLEVSARRAALVTGTALVLWGATAVQRATDDLDRCRWCDAGPFDEWARSTLRWDDPGAAGNASDVGLYGVTFGSAAAVALLAAREGDRREVIEDVFLVLAAVALADGLTRGVQHAVGRVRPFASDSEPPHRDRELRSFFSGHASRSFAAAAAATQVTRLRGRRGSAWVAVVAFTAAAATGWLRVAADQHWATDVLAGAAAGAAVGWAVPTLALRPAAGGPSARVLPAPGGIAIVF
jgi:membrane-associated phospholipid phosphatase